MIRAVAVVGRLQAGPGHPGVGGSAASPHLLLDHIGKSALRKTYPEFTMGETIIDVAVPQLAFIDFVLLAESNEPMSLDRFPPCGTELDAVVSGSTPKGELRLDATPSTVERWRSQ